MKKVTEFINVLNERKYNSCSFKLVEGYDSNEWCLMYKKVYSTTPEVVILRDTETNIECVLQDKLIYVTKSDDIFLYDYETTEDGLVALIRKIVNEL